jgi:N-acetyl-beta-hexosaminidase
MFRTARAQLARVLQSVRTADLPVVQPTTFELVINLKTAKALNLAKPETFTFLDRPLGEMVAFFPDQYFHVGGDEISGADWKANPPLPGSQTSQGPDPSTQKERRS